MTADVVARPPVLSRYDLAVETGKVAEYARAVWSRRLDRPHPMFSVTSGHVQNRRELIAEIGLDLRRVLHGSHEWRLARPLALGERLHAVTVLAETGEKQGRTGGAMRTATLRTTFTSPGGDIVLVEDMLLLELAAASGRGGGAAPTPAAPSPAADGAITRTDIVRFAGASGDFNPVHHDEEYAVGLGLPSVFAMGMLPAGIVGSRLTDDVDLAQVAALRVRFRDRVWPGDVLDVDIEPDAVGATATATRRADGKDVIDVRMTLREEA